MVRDDDWYDDPLDEETDDTYDISFYDDVPLYDEDGNEISDDDLL